MSGIENTKPGDKVAFIGSYERRPTRILTVERVTKTQIITEGGGRYRLQDGYEVGACGSWSRSRLVPSTAAHESRIEHDGYVSRLTGVRATKIELLDTATLRQACELLGL